MTKKEINDAMSDSLFRSAYGADWERIQDSKLFLHGYGYEKPTTIHGYEWSSTFNQWGALVTFSDGWHGFTYPKR